MYSNNKKIYSTARIRKLELLDFNEKMKTIKSINNNLMRKYSTLTSINK